ncbi:unnamed protein product [Spodoptera exigua]|nr:unnamed protein product [Spodoptera exigua]
MREPSAEVAGGGSLLRLGEELAKTFRPKLRTHAAAAPQRTAARDSALPLAPPRHHPRTPSHPCYYSLRVTLTSFPYSNTVYVHIVIDWALTLSHSTTQNERETNII